MAISPRKAEHYYSVRKLSGRISIVAFVIMIGQLAYYKVLEYEFHQEPISRSLTVAVLSLVVYLYIGGQYEEEMWTLTYWKTHHHRDGMFPLTAAEREAYRPMAEEVLAKKDARCMNASLNYYATLHNMEGSEGSLYMLSDEYARKKKRKRVLKALEKIFQQSDEDYDECSRFFKSAWPEGSGILSDPPGGTVTLVQPEPESSNKKSLVV